MSSKEMDSDIMAKNKSFENSSQIECYEMISNITSLYKEIGTLKEEVNRLKEVNVLKPLMLLIGLKLNIS